VIYGVDRSTISGAIRQIRPLLANCGFATPSGQRLRTLADLLAYAAVEGLTIRLDGTETQVRRPKANRPGRRAFVSGKKSRTRSRPPSPPRQAAVVRGNPTGRMHDQTAVKPTASTTSSTPIPA
jgi:hypothetical protein